MASRSANVIEKNIEVRELRVPADEGQLSKVRDFISTCCDEAGFSSRETNNTKLAVDEACTNIIKHAYSEVEGEVRIKAEISSGNISIHLFDTGERFDFAGVKDPDLDQYVETGRKGGLGVFLINRLMDEVHYRAGESGNELFMSKSSIGAVSRALPGHIGWRGTLRYKFTLRASLGFLILIAAIWSFVFVRQTSTIKEQRTTQWLEKRRLAESFAERSKALLLEPEEYSVEQTSLTAFISRILEGNDELSYVKVIDSEGTILSSSNIDEIFSAYVDPGGDTMLRDGDRIIWTRYEYLDRPVRDIEHRVQLRAEDTGQDLMLGSVHLGVWEDAVEATIADPRLLTTVILIVFFLIGVLLIAALVSVFVKPIQVLTDGVRAIGQGSFDGKISVEGPAEIGAIAAVFNEITEKFKTAQEGVLEREKFQKEIEVAKQIQHALLPKRHPDISGYDIAPYYQAAREVGGDYYDFVKVDDDTLGVVVADVSGKGVPGSLVMTMIRTALRMEARGNYNASDVMAKMNDFVTDDMRKGMFVTMFYVILDSTNRIISYASAGHNPMILFRAEKNETYFLNPKGFPVGISLPDDKLFRKAISLEKIKLKKDDMLLIYTDGVTEAMNEKREQFGEDRLIESIKKYGHLHPTEFIDRIDADIKAFTGGEPQNDDITIVAVKEKLAADDVLSGIRKKLIDLVEVHGMSVKEACAKMKVSPATFYRYRKRMEVMGERGLKNKVLRQDIDLKRVSIEERKELLEVLKSHPEFGAKRIAQEYNKEKEESRHLTQRMVYDELKRLGLNTKELRIEYLKRYRLYEEDQDAARKASREMVEDLLKAPSAEEPPVDAPAPEKTPEPDFLDELDQYAPAAPSTAGPGMDEDVPRERGYDMSGIDSIFDNEEMEVVGDLELNVVRDADDVTILRIDGHLDSVSTTALEQRLNDIIAKGALKMVVDLSSVSYISSGGWGIMVGEVKHLREQGGDVVLVGMSPEVYDVYDLLGFSDILRALPDIEAACAYFKKPVDERLAAEPAAPVGSPSSIYEETPGAEPPEVEPHRAEPAGKADPFKDMKRVETDVTEWDSLRIEAAVVGETGSSAVLSLTGIIDTVSAENLRQAIDKVIQNGIFRIVIDMSLVEYVSSGGWGTFTERLRDVRRQDGDIKLFGMDPDVYYIFTMLGFNIVLSSFDVLTDAIEDFDRAVDGKPTDHPQATVEQAPASVESAVETAAPAPAAQEPPEARVPELTEIDLTPSTTRGDEWARWEESDGILVGTVSGPIDAVAVDRLDSELEAKIRSKPIFLMLDFTRVDYISSTGWGLVAKYNEEVRNWGGSLTICGMTQELFEIFSLLELHSIISTYATRSEALASFSELRQGKEMSRPVSAVEPAQFEPIDRDELAAPSPIDDVSVEDILGPMETGTERHEEESPVEPASSWDEEETAGSAMSWAEDEPVESTSSRDDTDTVEKVDSADTAATENDPARSLWKSPSFDVEEEPEKVEAAQGGAKDKNQTEARDDVFVDLSTDSHDIDVDSAASNDYLSEDRKLRDMGWDQYGQKLKKIKKNKSVDKKVDDDTS